MSWVDDARKLVQDFVAPELRAIASRLDSADKLSAERHNNLLEKMESVRSELSLKLDLAMAKRRIEELEEKQRIASQQLVRDISTEPSRSTRTEKQ